jgi:WD40 repeat protein
MRSIPLPRFVLLLVLLCLTALAGCQGAPTPPTNSPPPQSTLLPTAPGTITPSPESTDAPSPLPTFSASPTLPDTATPTLTLIPRSLPQPATLLSVENASQLEELASWGSGAVSSSRVLAGGEVALLTTATEIRLLRADTLDVITILPGSAQLLVSTDESLLVAALWGESRLEVWRLPQGELLTSLEHPVEMPRYTPEFFSPEVYRSVTAQNISTDGSLLAAAFGNAEIVVWDTETWEQIALLKSNISNVSQKLVFSRDGSYLGSFETRGALGEWVGNPRLVLWNLDDFSLRGYISDPGYVGVDPFSSDSTRLLTSADYKVFIWNLFDLSLERTFASGAGSHAPEVSFSPDGEYILVDGVQVRRFSDGKRLNSYDEAAALASLGLGVEAPEPAPTLPLNILEQAGYYPAFTDLSLLADGSQLLAWGTQGTHLYWLSLPDETFTSLDLGVPAMNNAVLTPGGKILVLCLQSGDMVKVELASGVIQKSLGCRSSGRLAFLADGRLLRTNGMNVDVVSFPDGAVTNTLRGHTANVLSLFAELDGPFILSGARTVGDYAGVNLWTSDPALALVTSFAIPDLYPTQSSGVEALAISPNSLQITAARPSGGVDAFHLSGEYQLWTAKVDRAFSLSYSPDSSLLAVGTNNGMLQIIETKRGEVLYPPPVDPEPVEFFDRFSFAPPFLSSLSVLFQPDGTGIYSAGADGIVRLWGLP